MMFSSAALDDLVESFVANRYIRSNVRSVLLLLGNGPQVSLANACTQTCYFCCSAIVDPAMCFSHGGCSPPLLPKSRLNKRDGEIVFTVACTVHGLHEIYIGSTSGCSSPMFHLIALLPPLSRNLEKHHANENLRRCHM